MSGLSARVETPQRNGPVRSNRLGLSSIVCACGRRTDMVEFVSIVT